MFKHMKQWNNKIVHSSFHPGEGEFQKANARVIEFLWLEMNTILGLKTEKLS